MAVQAPRLAHAFAHDSRAIRSVSLSVSLAPRPVRAASVSTLMRPALPTGYPRAAYFYPSRPVGSSSLALVRDCMAPAPDDAAVFHGEPVGRHLLNAVAAGDTVFSDPRSDLTCNVGVGGGGGGLAPRKRAREIGADAVIMDGHRALLPPVPQAFATAEDARDRVLCSAAASTSGRPPGAAAASHGVLSQLYRHGVEMDALIRIENERLRAGLEETRRRHLRAVVSAVDRVAARRLRAAQADLERALARNAELDEKLRQMGAEGQAWQGIASSNEAAAAGLRATLDQLLQSPPCPDVEEGEGDAEDARSCCFGQERAAARSCRACGEADACVLLLPCRHLCLCAGCEAAAEACPVCAAAKNASLHVLLS